MGIRVRRATREQRIRDARRDRLVLQVGEQHVHITRDEARRLRNQLGKFKLDVPPHKT